MEKILYPTQIVDVNGEYGMIVAHVRDMEEMNILVEFKSGEQRECTGKDNIKYIEGKKLLNLLLNK